MTRTLLTALCCVSLIISCKDSATADNDPATESPDRETMGSLPEKVALAHGYKNWKNVEQIDFTFKVAQDGQDPASRSWKWEPKTDHVTMMTPEDTVRYQRCQVDSTMLKADQAFINDVYWLLPQFKMVWDEGTEITDREENGQSIVTVRYTGNEGYTPGDRYDLYLDKDSMINRWDYYRAGADSVSMAFDFSDYHDHKGIKIAHDHRQIGDSVRIYFDNVRVTTKTD